MKSIFLKKQGDNPKNRIWDFLIVHSEYDYSMKEIARYTKKKITPYDSAESKTELSFSGIPEIRPEQRSCEQTLDDSPEWSDFCDSKVGYTSLKRILKEFRQKNLVVQTRTIGKAKLYKLNLKNPVVKKFIDFFWAVVESVVEKDLKIKEKSEEPYKSSSSVEAVSVSAKSV